MSYRSYFIKVILMITVLLCGFFSGLFAHEVRPAYLELHQTGPDTYDLLWKLPANGNLRLGLYVKLPAGCINQTPPRATMIQQCLFRTVDDKMCGRTGWPHYLYRWSQRHGDRCAG